MHRTIRLLFLFFLIALSSITTSFAQEIEDSITIKIDTLAVPDPNVSDSVSILHEVNDSCFEKILDLSPSVQNRNTQGGACYDKYLFVGYNSNTQIDIYDLEEKELSGRIYLDNKNKNPRFHANTLSFSQVFFKKGDQFPILYISAGYTINKESDQSVVLAYRIQKRESTTGKKEWTADQVQTIQLQGFGKNNWTECILDDSDNALWISFTNKNKMFLKYLLPETNETEYFINRKETIALDTILVNGIKVIGEAQGHLKYQNRFFIPSGVPSRRKEPYLSIIDCQEKDYKYIISLYDLGLMNKNNPRDDKWEPEYVFFYHDDFYIGYRRAVYKVKMDSILESFNYCKLLNR